MRRVTPFRPRPPGFRQEVGAVGGQAERSERERRRGGIEGVRCIYRRKNGAGRLPRRERDAERNRVNASKTEKERDEQFVIGWIKGRVEERDTCGPTQRPAEES